MEPQSPETHRTFTTDGVAGGTLRGPYVFPRVVLGPKVYGDSSVVIHGLREHWGGVVCSQVDDRLLVTHLAPYRGSYLLSGSPLDGLKDCVSLYFTLPPVNIGEQNSITPSCFTGSLTNHSVSTGYYNYHN